jgi:hypothetical protein
MKRTSQSVRGTAASLLFTGTAVLTSSIGLRAAAAQTVSDASWSGKNIVSFSIPADPPSCCANTVPITGPGTYPNSLLGGRVSSTVVTTGEPFPSLSVSSQTSASSSPEALSAQSNADLNYYIEVLGPEPTVTLGLLGSAKLAASGADGSTTSQIQLILRDEAITNIVAGVNYQQGSATPVYSGDGFGSGVQAGFDPASFTLETSFSIPTSSLLEVSMVASADALSIGGQGSASASAYLDPYFFIDPSTANLGEYSILVSEGIGNLPATPEPSTWAMMLLGFAGLSFVGYRASRRTDTAD